MQRACGGRNMVSRGTERVNRVARVGRVKEILG